MRIPKAVQIYKNGLPLTFSGLKVGNDLSNRTSVVSASSSWTIWYDPVTGKNKRCSAADGLLWAPSQQRRSLTVLANNTVTKVTFDKHLKATGVTFASSLTKGEGPVFTVKADNSVILAAGTLATAPILERSGVGKASVLAAANVKQLVDLPGVGANLNVCYLNLFSCYSSVGSAKIGVPYLGPTWVGDVSTHINEAPKRHLARRWT